MYKIMTVAALLVGLALAPVLGSEFRADAFSRGARGSAQPGSVETKASKHADPADAREMDEMSSCSWSCEACQPDQGCSQICTEVGECGSVCGVMARCDAGLRWDESVCACVTR